MLTVFVISSLVLAAFSFYSLRLCVRRQDISPSGFFSYSSCFHVGIGGLMALCLAQPSEFEKFLASQDIDYSSLTIANVLVLGWCVGLLAIDRILGKAGRVDVELMKKVVVAEEREVAFYIFASIVFIVEAYLFLQQEMSFGVIQSSGFYTNPLAQLQFYLRIGLAIACIIKNSALKWRVVDVIIFLVCLTLLVINGRRLLFIVFSFWLFWMLIHRVKKGKLLAIGVVAVIVFGLGARLFLSLRLVREERGEISVAETVRSGIDGFVLGETEKGTAVMSSLRENLEVRPAFAVAYMGILVEKAEGKSAALGAGLVNEVERVVPRLLNKNKDSVISIGGSEGIAEMQYGIPPEDRANSLIATGYVDFKYLYIISIAYAFAIFLAYAIAFRLVRPGIFAYFLLGPFTYSAFEYEQDLSVHLVGLRFVVIVLLLDFCTRIFLARRSKANVW